MLEKPKLFLTKKQFWLSMLFLFSLLLVRLFSLYVNYNEFKEKPLFYTDVDVIQAYEKWSDNNYYTIMKLYAPLLDITFFSRTKIRADDLSSHLRLKLFPRRDMSFIDYLGTSFIYSNVNQIYKNTSLKSKALNWVESQHESRYTSNFYNAIYFAEPLNKELRQQVSRLGISHLIALSGFHLAILSTLFFFLLRPLYRFFQQRYFPYRFDLLDIGFIVLLLLAWYLWFVDTPASLLRSYMMMLVGWILLFLGIELLSLTFLITISLLLLIVFPKLLLSLAFWFSISGVSYVFLILYYGKNLNKYLLSVIISFGLFILMLPLVHTVFPLVTPLQLFSPFLSLLFSLFYPISMGLHLLGWGAFSDSGLEWLFHLQMVEHQVLLSFKWGCLYLILSLSAFFSKRLFYLLLFVALSYFIGLFIGFLL